VPSNLVQSHILDIPSRCLYIYP